jgi:Ni,Fe-hydrogenase maturation factor
MGRVLFPDAMPKRTTLVGIEGVCFQEIGVGMSPEVAAAVHPAVSAVLAQVEVQANGA